MWPTIALVVAALLVVLAHALLFRATPLGGFDYAALGLTLLFVPVYFFALRVPRSPGRLAAGQTLPALSFVAEDGRTVSSAELLRGPALFVFYRGFW
jgi:hypothetical protein